jgi:hypothetical protein
LAKHLGRPEIDNPRADDCLMIAEEMRRATDATHGIATAEVGDGYYPSVYPVALLREADKP